MNIYDYSIEQLEQYFLEKGEKKFKATQVFEWLYRKRVTSFEEMTNLRKDLIASLNNDFIINRLKIVVKQSDVDVDKYLFELDDGNKIEAVVMNHDYVKVGD